LVHSGKGVGEKGRKGKNMRGTNVEKKKGENRHEGGK